MPEYNGSWLKLYRSIRHSDLLKHPNALAVFIFLLTRARLSDGFVAGIEVEQGQAVSSWKDIAEHTGLTRQEIRTAITNLKKGERLTTKPTNKFTVFTIVNWERFQGGGYEATTNPTNEQPTSNQQATNKQPTSNHIDRSIEDIKIEDRQVQVGADEAFPEAMVKLYSEQPPTIPTAIECIRLSHPSFERVPEFQLVNALESHPDREKWGESIEALAQGFGGVGEIRRPIPALSKYLGYEEKQTERVWGE